MSSDSISKQWGLQVRSLRGVVGVHRFVDRRKEILFTEAGKQPKPLELVFYRILHFHGLRGPALVTRQRRTGDLPVLVHVVSQRSRVLRLRRTEQPLASSVAAVLPSSISERSRHPDPSAFEAQ